MINKNQHKQNIRKSKNKNFSKDHISNFNKIILSLSLFAYFLAGYFFCQTFFIGTIHSGSIFIDDLTPFVPFFMLFYVLGYFIVLIPVIMIKDKKEFYSMILSFFLILTISFSIFIVLPLDIERPTPSNSDIFSKLIVIQQTNDKNTNTFPSLHVSQDFFAFLIIRKHNKKLGNYIIPLVLLIIFSTMFVKQHNFIDVIGGVILASFAYWFYKKKIVTPVLS